MGNRMATPFRRRGYPYVNDNPNPPPRFGTARRDAYGNLLPGEYNGFGRPVGQESGGEDIQNRPMGFTPMAKWQELFPPVALGSGGTTAAPSVQASSMPKAFRTASPGTGAAPDVISRIAGNAVSAAQAATAARSAGGAPQGPTPSGATVDAAPSGPQIGDTRRTPFGGTETLMDSRTGPRWVGSTSSAPAATNFMPGDAGTNSLADVVTHSGKAAPAPKIRPDGTKIAPNIADNAAYYRPGGAFGSVVSVDKPGGYGSSRVLGQDEPAVAPTQDQATAIAKKYGDPTGGTNASLKDLAASGFYPTKAKTSGVGMGDLKTAERTPLDTFNESIPGIGPAAGAGSVPPTTSAAPVSVTQPTASTPSRPARLSWETDADVAARQAASRPIVYSSDPAHGTTGLMDSLGKGNLSAAGVWTGKDIGNAWGDITRAAGSAMGSASDAMRGTAGEGSPIDNLLKKGRTAFGSAVTPLKGAVATMQQVSDDQPKRQDLLQSAGYSGSDE